MAHLWSGRFAGDPDAALFEFGSSFRFDRRLFEDDVRGSLAWADALEKAGVLTADDASRIKAALEAIARRGGEAEFFASDAARQDEDVHAFVERELTARVGDAGRRLHTGRSRNEQVSVDLRLYLKRRIPLLQRTLASLVGVLANQADASGGALMPSYTHMRRAQPVMAAHFFLAHAAACRRDYRRFEDVLEEIDELPIGYSKDLQEDKEGLFDAEDTVRASLDAAGAVVAGVSLNAAATEAAASGLLLATDVADYLVARGMPFREAHEVVGSLVRRLLAERRSFENLTLDEWRAHSPLFDANVREAITAAASVGKKRTPQSTHPDAVAAALTELRGWLLART
jgi:argininosuccinate lyase